MHATDTQTATRSAPAPSAPAPARGREDGGRGARPVARDDGRPSDGARPDWPPRPELLRRGGRTPAVATTGAGIRLRRERRVFASFSALPSLARPPLNLRQRRR